MIYMLDLTRRPDGSYVETCKALPNFGFIYRAEQVTETDTCGTVKDEYEALIEHIQRIYVAQSIPVPIDRHDTDYPSRERLLELGETFEHNSFMVVQPTHAMFILLYNRMLHMGLTWDDVAHTLGINGLQDRRSFVRAMHLGSEDVDNGACQMISDVLGCHIDIRLTDDEPSNTQTNQL